MNRSLRCQDETQDPALPLVPSCPAAGAASVDFNPLTSGERGSTLDPAWRTHGSCWHLCAGLLRDLFPCLSRQTGALGLSSLGAEEEAVEVLCHCATRLFRRKARLGGGTCDPRGQARCKRLKPEPGMWCCLGPAMPGTTWVHLAVLRGLQDDTCWSSEAVRNVPVITRETRGLRDQTSQLHARSMF